MWHSLSWTSCFIREEKPFFGESLCFLFDPVSVIHMIFDISSPTIIITQSFSFEER